MCRQHVNRLDSELADSVTHAPSVLTHVGASCSTMRLQTEASLQQRVQTSIGFHRFIPL